MMKKRVALGLITAMALSTGVAMASPMDMEEGKTNVYVGAVFSGDTEVDDGYEKLKFDGDTGFYGGVTYGINDKWGVQLDYNSYGSEIENGMASLGVDVEALELNVVYKVNPYLNAFAGYVTADADLDLKIGGSSVIKDSADTNGVQIGVMGKYPFSDKFDAFAKVAVGNNSNMYELGVSYEVAENWNVDLSYRNAQYDDFEGLDGEVDGIRLGVSASF